ncbi:2421_t:CDS:10 [Entrophospora sp. SA101]|nr:2421_t:CDS:10 [Entrophospora sp. SA101]
MFLTRSEYDRGVNTFSPEGRLFQVEYAIEAIKLGSTAVGIQTSQGVVLAVEKRVTSPLLVSSSIEKIMEIDRHLGCAMSGLTADSRTMIDHARVAAQSHTFTYAEKIKVESVTQAVCDLALRFGESAHGEDSIMSRPFGVALLIAGIDEKGPQLYHADPSGTFMQYDAKAIGSGSEGAQTELQEEYHKSLTLEEAETLSLKVLKQVMEEKLNNTNVELASVTPELLLRRKIGSVNRGSSGGLIAVLGIGRLFEDEEYFCKEQEGNREFLTVSSSLLSELSLEIAEEFLEYCDDDEDDSGGNECWDY